MTVTKPYWVSPGNTSRIVRDTSLKVGDRVELIDDHQVALFRWRHRGEGNPRGTIFVIEFAGTFEGYVSRGGDCWADLHQVDKRLDPFRRHP